MGKTLLGRIILILYKRRWIFRNADTYYDYLKSINKGINAGLWFFSFDKFGYMVGASWFEYIDPNSNHVWWSSMKKNHPIEFSRLELQLVFFWAETGSGKIFMQELRDALRTQCKGVIYNRIKHGKHILKMLTQEDTTTFMRSSNNPDKDADIPFLQTEAARNFYLPMQKAQTDLAKCVGEMALFMAHSPLGAISPPKLVLERMQICAKLEQYRFYASPNGTTTGFLTWGWLTQERLFAAFININSVQAFEWSEGPHLAIIDIVANTETEALLRADLAGLLYPDEDIWLLCQSKGRVFFKKWAKQHRKELLNLSQDQAGILIGTLHELYEEKP